ncbi:MAG: UDP-N-acetylmuramoyl-L-alanyl-D-glutamate--2,6-diaminopimelate ligase [Planctomycetota bacterium]
MDLKELLRKAIGLTVDTSPPIEITDICEDSRRVTPGALFVAVPGTKADGATFIADAISRGASAVLIGEDSPPTRQAAGRPVPIIKAPDPRMAVARIAAVLFGLEEIQSSGKLHCIGVTGTNGKSTFAFMVRHLFRAAGRTTALFGTIEYDLVSRTIASELTTPDAVTLTRHLVEAQRAGATHAVLEVSSHSLDQRRTDGIDFAVAVFTNLTQDHLDYHGTLENYLLAKKRLFDGLRPDAVAVVNGHDPASDRIVADCRARVLRYGLRVDCDVRGTILKEDRTGGRFLLEYEGKHVEIQTPLVGRHNIFNALSAAATALASGLDLVTIQKGLADLQHVPGRLQRVPTGDLGLDIFVDYAHTDDALRNVLSALRPLTTGRLCCVFGCGGDRDRLKRPKMARAVVEGCDDFVITSDNPRTEDPIAILADIERGLNQTEMIRGITISDRARAIQHAITNLAPGDCLVIAGKGHENYQIHGTKKIHFDDVEVAGEAVARRRAEGVCAR